MKNVGVIPSLTLLGTRRSEMAIVTVLYRPRPLLGTYDRQ